MSAPRCRCRTGYVVDLRLPEGLPVLRVQALLNVEEIDVTDLAVTPPADEPEPKNQVSQRLFEYLHLAAGRGRGGRYPMAWELAELTRIERYDIAPWLFF